MELDSNEQDPAVISDSERVVSEYSVFWKQSAPTKRTLLLQFPGRHSNQRYNLAESSKPLAIRIKPLSGLVEIDVPISFGRRYDYAKGSKFGTALKESRSAQSGFLPGRGEYGLAGGFGINAHHHGRPKPNSGRGNDTSTTADRELDGPDPAMRSLTLGGRLRVFKRGDPIYTIGAFKDQLHLSKVDGICSLQPQFHHLDAVADNERVNSRNSSGAEHVAIEPEARAVNLTVKSTDQEAIDINEVDRMLRAMQEETWQSLEWVDESEDQSILTFENDLMLVDPDHAGTLVSTMTEEQYLDAISAPRIDPTRQGRQVMISRQWDEVAEEAIVEEDDDKPGQGSATPKPKIEPE